MLEQNTLSNRLKFRNTVESQYKELFQSINIPIADALDKEKDDNVDASPPDLTKSQLLEIINIYRNELMNKEKELNQLKEVMSVMNKNNERLNDEIISLTIENNVLQEKIKLLNVEHNKLIQRWLLKAQRDADIMNATIESSSNKSR
ncbi:Atg16p PWA37_002005 [Arxiozyma heterogenica]|uniref:Autophagy-related protein 16 domain-containing protein n=1 Tax=Arxiozyma heterogenica TaxID=278026 RepID=A0AAN8A7M0_9SACH|nr:hypothetical protein RI543_001473 [Kazachstania heterogenica]